MSLTTRVRRGLAGTLAAALATGGLVALASPSQAAPSEPVNGASFTWALSDEQGGGAFFGGCNFLSAGKAGDTGSSRPWTSAEYKASDGNVRIEKPSRSGTVTPIWATKCLDRNGVPVNAGTPASTTENYVRLSAGTGSRQSDGSGTISWTGSFTSAFYGGMTYWSATDPTLTFDGLGNATLTATLGGYGADRIDATKWVKLDEKAGVVLAEFTGAWIDGFSDAPANYLGVDVDDAAFMTRQTVTGPVWGSFPQGFVDYQQLTGQSSYWYSSGGARDTAKPAKPAKLTFGDTPVPPLESAPVVTGPVVTPPAPPAPAPAVIKATTAKPTVTVSKKPTSKKKGKATVTVKSSGSNARPTGKVTITLTKGKSKKKVSVSLKSGKATVSLPKLKKGAWKLKVTYAGSATQRAATSKTYTVKSSK